MPHTRRQQGIALLTAMIVAAVTVALATGLVVRQQRDIQRVDADRAAMAQAFAVDDVLRETMTTIDGPKRRAVSSVEATPPADAVALESSVDEDARFRRVLKHRVAVADSQSGERTSAAEVSLTHDLTFSGELDRWQYRADVTDPQHALNLNALADPTAQPIIRDRLGRLFELLDLDPDLLNALTDWIDEDATRRNPGGAEDDVYTRKTPPYRAANAPLGRIEELRLVRGFNDDVIGRLAPYVAVLPPDVALNINTADELVLRSLHEELDDQVAAEIVRRRELNPFASTSDFVKMLEDYGVPMITAGLTTQNSHVVVRVALTRDGRTSVERVELVREPAGYRVLQRFAEDV